MKAEVAKKYKLVGLEPGKHQIVGFGTIDFENISLGEADELFKAKLPYLQKIPKDAQK